MRISSVLATAIAAPVLLVVTACGNDPAKPEPPSLRGTVVEKVYVPPVYDERRVDVTKKSCTTDRKTGKKNCKKVRTGEKKLVTYKVKDRCFLLYIRTEDYKVVETCDEDAYGVLDPKDGYDSSKNYSEVPQ